MFTREIHQYIRLTKEAPKIGLETLAMVPGQLNFDAT